MSSKQDQHEFEENQCEKGIGLRRSKRNKYHLDVAAMLKHGGCSSSQRNYSPPVKRKWASRRPEGQTPPLEELATTQQQKSSPRKNAKNKQLETSIEEQENEANQNETNQEFEHQGHDYIKTNSPELEESQNNQIENTDDANILEQKPEEKSLELNIEADYSITETVIEEGSSTLDICSTYQIPISDLSKTQQDDDEFKRMHKVPLHHNEYCEEESEEDEAGEDEEEMIYKEIKVEYMINDGVKAVGVFSCPGCPAVFESRVGLTNHLKLHGSKKLLPCEICDFSCTNKKTMRQHRRVHGLTRRLRGNPVSFPFASTSMRNYQDCPILEVGTSNQVINNKVLNIKEEVFEQNNRNITNINTSEENHDEDCEEPFVVINSLDEIATIGNTDHFDKAFDDHGFTGGSSEDAMPILEQIIPSPDLSLHSINEKEMTLSDFERRTVKGDDDKNMLYVEQIRKREEKTGNKRRQLNSFVNLSALANLKDFNEKLFCTKKSNPKIYDRNTVHCPKCPFRTQSRLRLAPHMAGHERTSGFVCSVCQFKNESSGLLRRHCQLHESDGLVCKWPPDYVGSPTLGRGNKQNVTQLRQDIRDFDNSLQNPNLTLNNLNKTMREIDRNLSRNRSDRKSLNCSINSGVLNKHFDYFSKQQNLVKFSGSNSSFSKSSVFPKNLCRFSCRWCSLLFWSGPAGLLLHKLRRHARMDKQRISLYKELLSERLAWRPPKPTIEANADNVQDDSLIFSSSNITDFEAKITPKNFRCSHCPYNTDQILRLQKHENKHILKAEHHCKHCSYSCRSVHILLQHSRLHDGESTTSSSIASPNVISTLNETHNQQTSNSPHEVLQQNPSTTNPSKRGYFRRRETNFCPHCPYKSKHNCDMKAHLKMHVERRKFACRHCTYSTMRQNALISHEKLHQINITDKEACRRVKWIYAKDNGTRSAHLGWRMRILSSGWHFYRCSIVECGAEFAFCSDLVQHSRHHHLAWWKKRNEAIDCGFVSSAKNLIRCTICGFRTVLELRIRDHEAVHQGDEFKHVRSVGGIFNCKECPYSTANYAKFWNHRQKHKRANRFACALCSFSSGSVQCYIEHSKLHSNAQQLPKLESEEAIDKISNSLKLETFDSEILNDTVLPASDPHQLRSGDLPKFHKHKFKEQFGAVEPVIEQLKNAVGSKNSTLGKDTDSSSSHSSLKTNSRSCMECPYETNDSVFLKLHLQMHKRGGVRPYSCNLCTYRCFSAESLHSHLSLHSNVKNVSSNDNANQQLQKASSSNFYQCSQCNFKCVEMESFLVHRKEHVQLFQQRLMTIIKRSSNDNLIKENKTRFPRNSRSDKQHFCTRCSFKCDSLQAFSLHMEHHKLYNDCQTGIFSCSICDYNSNTKNVIIFHEKNHHLDVPLTSLCLAMNLREEENNRVSSSTDVF